MDSGLPSQIIRSFSKAAGVAAIAALGIALASGPARAPVSPPRLPFTFLSELVDSSGAVDDMVKEVSLAFDKSGVPSILYVTGSFRFAKRDGQGWRIEDLRKQSHGENTSSLLLDAHGNPWIAFYSVYDQSMCWGNKSNGRWAFHVSDPRLYSIEARIALGPDARFWGAARDLSNGLVSLSSLGTLGPQVDYQDSSRFGDGLALALDPAGDPHLVYEIAQACDQGELVEARRDRGVWRREPIATGDGRKIFVELAVAPNGKEWLAYATFPHGDLHLAEKSGGAWRDRSIAEPVIRGPISMKLDADGWPWLAWRDWSRQAIYCAHLEGDRWQTAQVDSGLGVGEALALALDPNGDPAVAYYDSIYGDTKLATGTRTEPMVVRPRAWMAALPSSLIEREAAVPLSLTIRVANPLPAGGSFAVGNPDDEEVTVSIVTVSGRVVATPYRGPMPRGWRTLSLPDGLGGGVYFLLVSTARDRRIAKLVLIP